MTETFTRRSLELQTVKSKEVYADGRGAITGSGGWTAGAPKEVIDLLSVGDEYELETHNFSTITGWRVGGKWIERKSDETLADDRQKMLDGFARRDRETLERNRDDWSKRELALPVWLAARLATFHEKGGEQFELSGWGYELTICELAVLYVASNLEDDDSVNAFSREHGTSGNQHDAAKAIAHQRLADPNISMAGTISALSPLTGSAFYEATA